MEKISRVVSRRLGAVSAPSARRAPPGDAAFDAAGECRARDGFSTIRPSPTPRARRASNGSRSETYPPIFVDVFSLVAAFRLVVKSRRSTTRRVVKKREGTLHLKFKA